MSEMLVRILMTSILLPGLFALAACAQPEEGVTSEELRTVVQEAVAESQTDPEPSGPSAIEIREIVKSVVQETLAESRSAPAPTGPSAAEIREIVNSVVQEILTTSQRDPAPSGPTPEQIREIVLSAVEEVIADIPSAEELNILLETVSNESAVATMNGSCGPSLNSCEAGTLVNVEDTDTSYKWQCRGEGDGLTANCCSPKSEATSGDNGRCGPSLNSCEAGTIVNLDDTDTHYLWQCQGEGDGLSSTCSLPKTEAATGEGGRCGPSLNSCEAGTIVNLDDTDTHYLWQCQGEGDGLSSTCSLPKTEAATGEGG